MPRPGYDVDDVTGEVRREQTGNMLGTPETEYGVRGGLPNPHGSGQSEFGRELLSNNPIGMGAFSNDLAKSSGPWRGILNTPRGNVYQPVSDLQEQARLEQQRVIQELQRQAAGDLNSLAQQQLQSAYGLAKAQQSSLGSSMRGQSAGAAMRGIQQGQQDIQRGFAGDQQMLKLQEQQAAQAMLAQMLNQQRGQDTSWQQGLSGIANGRQALDNLYQQFMTGQEYGLDVAERDADLENIRTKLGLDLDARANARGALNNVVNAGATAAGTYFSTGGNQQPYGFNPSAVTGLQGSDPNEWAPYPGSNSGSIVPYGDK